MSAGTRVPYALASRVAAQLAGVLAVGCERVAVAGSIRRKEATVGDIEIVAIPRTHRETIRAGLFEDSEVEVDELQVTLDALIADGTLMLHPDDPKRGPRYSKLVHVESGIQVDIFSAATDTYGMALLIRTGPAAYSQWVVTEARARRYHVAKGYEIHPGGMSCGAIPCQPIPTPEEEDVFAVLEIHPTTPESRGKSLPPWAHQ